MRCDAVRCDAVRCDAVRCGAVRCDVMRCGGSSVLQRLASKRQHAQRSVNPVALCVCVCVGVCVCVCVRAPAMRARHTTQHSPTRHAFASAASMTLMLPWLSTSGFCVLPPSVDTTASISSMSVRDSAGVSAGV
jgi:hypothetical protein